MTRLQAISLAREMYDDGNGWTITEIRVYLADRGVVVARETVHAWADPEWAERRNAAMREVKRRHDRGKRGTLAFRVFDADAKARLREAVNSSPIPAQTEATPELLLALRLEDRLGYPAIAAVLRRFFDEDLTPEQVRDRLNKLGAPKNDKKAANARAQARRRQMRVAA